MRSALCRRANCFNGSTDTDRDGQLVCSFALCPKKYHFPDCSLYYHPSRLTTDINEENKKKVILRIMLEM